MRIMGGIALLFLILGCASESMNKQYPSTEGLAPDDTEQIASIEARAPRIVAEAIRQVGEELGHPDPDPESVRVEVVMGLRRREQGGWSAARTSGWDDSVTITLNTEF